MSFLLRIETAHATASLRVVEGGSAAPGAWIAMWQHRIWICWDDPAVSGDPSDTTCWQRVDFQMPNRDRTIEISDDEQLDLQSQPTADLSALPSVSRWRAAFVDSTRAILVSPTGQAWLLGRSTTHKTTPQPIQIPTEAHLLAPREATCSRSTGWLPTVKSGSWSWRFAQCHRLHVQKPRQIHRSRPLWLPQTQFAFEYLQARAVTTHGAPAMSHRIRGDIFVQILLTWRPRQLWSLLARTASRSLDEDASSELGL